MSQRGSYAKRARIYRPRSLLSARSIQGNIPEQCFPDHNTEVNIKDSSSGNRKTYADFLKYRNLNDDQKTKIDTLTSCLQNRINLPSHSDNGCQLPRNSPSSIRHGFQQELRPSEKSWCDTILDLISGFDAAGVAEIFRLLLERRSALPLFVPSSKEHYLPLLSHITFGNNSRIGEDTSLMRIAVVSRRQRSDSQTCELLKSLFHIHSIHTEDLQTDSITINDLIAEIGIGCILTKDSSLQKAQDFLVVHVVGDFILLWPFLLEFMDYLFIEDATEKGDSFTSWMADTTPKAISKPDLASIDQICIWKPSFGKPRQENKVAEKHSFQHLYIEGQMGERTTDAIKSSVIQCFQEHEKTKLTKKRTKLCQLTILDGKFAAVSCPSIEEIESSLEKISSTLVNIKKNVFLLQQNFEKQAEFEEALNEHRNNQEMVRENEIAIQECLVQRQRDARQVKNDPLLLLFCKLLSITNQSDRGLSIWMLEKSLIERSQRELDRSNNGENSETSGTGSINSAFSVEHLWRELGHLWVALNHQNFELEIFNIPRQAAQYLLDGFSLELLDGDSNLINLDWIKRVFGELNTLVGKHGRERIFVLSVMGVQSSGKSTLLNTMFGIQMRTSVGQCTRGVSMQFLAVEGRQDYDYILLLDSEGTRASEFHGLHGSEKRDNQIATLNILLSDATIIVIPVENDAAVKEILPVVKMAYQGSKLAEANGGQLSSLMFFVYNRIDTNQKGKLGNIIKSLETQLNEAFYLAQNLNDGVTIPSKSDKPLGDFNLDTSNSSESDVRIVGNVKDKFEPPGDIPNSAFGAALVELREHIHRRVTSPKNGTSWRGRSTEDFSTYICEVWKCICSANFSLNFASVMERSKFDRMDWEFKEVDNKLAESYRAEFDSLKIEMIKEKGRNVSNTARNQSEFMTDQVLLSYYENRLRDHILSVELDLDKEMEVILNVNIREKWRIGFQEIWKISKLEKSRHWASTLKTTFSTLFDYEHHVDMYKKKIREEISAFFKSNYNKKEVSWLWPDEQKKTKFDDIYGRILEEVQQKFPSKNVPESIAKVYEESNVIKKRQIVFDSFYVRKENLQRKVNVQNSTFCRQEPCPQSEKNFLECWVSINRVVNNIVAGKTCYDDSIISSGILEFDEAIKSCHITTNSEVQKLHSHGRELITDLMKLMQEKWEINNSVYAKLKQQEMMEDMFSYFKMVSLGVRKTKLFTFTLGNTLTSSLARAFEEEMICRTSNRIRNERWLHDARYMHKHIDLYLVGLLKKKKIQKVLEFMFTPKPLYMEVLKRLIAQKVPSIAEESRTFFKYLKGAIREAAVDSTYTDRERAQQFVCSLSNILLKCGLQSEYLSTKFMMDVRGEFDDCDNEEENNFLEFCMEKLTRVMDNYKPPTVQKFYARKLSPKVIEYLLSLNDAAALPRCDVSCPLCGSMCIETANHDPKLRPHDAVHQPAGIAGVYGAINKEIFATTCSQRYAEDDFFERDGKTFSYKEFSKVFTDWRDPLINEELPLREYILATYNQYIADWYSLKPCSKIPPCYYRDLQFIQAQLKRDLGL